MLTEEQQRKLAALTNRATSYELVLTHPDGRRVLLCYSGRKSHAGLVAVVRSRADAVAVFLGLSLEKPFGYVREKGKTMIRFPGGGTLDWSGRTKRDAIMGGELPFVAAPALAGGLDHGLDL